MRKTLLTKLALLLVMLVGVGSAWAATAVLPGSQALTTSFANVGTDTHIQIKSSSENSYTNPLRIYANTTVTIKALDGYVIQSVTYEASSTGNYVTYAQNATVNPNVTPAVSGTKVTWTLSDVSEFTFKPSAQTRANSITIAYTSSGGGDTPTTYIVTYDANGGTGTLTDSNSPYTSGATVTVLANTFTRDNYTFSNWNTAADGSGTEYDEDDTFAINANTTLYAQWTANGSGTGTTVTLTQSNLELTGSYPSSDTEKTINGITYVFADLMKDGENIQARASTGTIKNSTAYPGDITSVAITHYGTARATTINGSTDGKNWTQVATGSGSITADFSGKGYKYFQITRGSNAAYWEKIEITYSTSSSSLKPSDLTITNASTDLSFDLYNNAAAQVINYTTSSTGAVTVTPASPTSYFSYVLDATAKTITVTPLAVTPNAQTITINQVADDDYYGGTVTFTVSVTNNKPATLPFSFDGGKSDIENTDGLTHSGLDSDYSSSPKLKFNDTGDYLILKINENPGILTFDIKGNSFSGGTFTVQTSEDGTTYTDLKKYSNLDNTKNEILALPLTARYVKWIYTKKSSGNVALGNISLAKPVAVTSFGWATYITPCDMQFEADNAFIVTEASVAGGLTLSEVTKVPADSPILLKGEGEKAMTSLSVAPSALDDMSDNKLSVCDGTIESGKYPYVLAKEGKGAAFKQWKGNYSVLDGRVVLLLDEAVSAARSFFMLDGETTGIASVKVSQSTEQVYDLQGRRVAQPTKGLYIVNGKKMILK